MKFSTYILGFILLNIWACQQIPSDDGSLPPPLYPQPQSHPLDTVDGYKLNTLTGDSIDPIINELGDTVITGTPIPAIPRKVDPSSISPPIKVRASSNPPQVRVISYHVKSVNNPRVIPVDHKSLTVIPLPEISHNDTFHYLINAMGDTIPTGIPLAIKHRSVPFHYPEIHKAPAPGMKDDATLDIQFLNVQHGLGDEVTGHMIKDKFGHLWFSSRHGVNRYDGRTMMHITEKEGLPDNWLMCVHEDRLGALWFGLKNGFSRFNGQSFTHFGGMGYLSGSQVLEIVEDKNSNIWLANSKHGVSRYDGKSITHFTVKEGLSTSWVISAQVDKSGNIWFGTFGGGVNRFDGESFTHFTEKDGLVGNSVRTIMEDRSGKLWFGTDSGVCFYDGQSFTHLTKENGLSNNRIFGLYEDSSGEVWIATWGGGVCRYNGKTITVITEDEGLSSNWVHTIIEDDCENLWIGTSKGISRYNVHSFEHLKEDAPDHFDQIRSIWEDRSGEYWLGSWMGGITHFDGETYTTYTRKEGLSNNLVLAICEDDSGLIWLGTNNGISSFDGKNFTHFTEEQGVSNRWVGSIIQDRNGTLWLGTNNGVTCFDGRNFTHFNEEGGLGNNMANSIIEDKKGNIWIATWGGGITKYDGESFTHFSEREGLSSNEVTSIMEDKNGNIWIGTWGGGVSHFNGKSFTHFSEREGLTDNIIYSIVEDKSGSIWIGTKTGLNLIEPTVKDNSKVTNPEVLENTFRIVSFDANDGLQNPSFHFSGALVDSRNHGRWGTSSSLTKLDLNKFTKSSQALEVFLKQIDINGEVIDFRNSEDSLLREVRFSAVKDFENYPIELELPYSKNHLSFHYSAIDWAAPHKIQFSTRMLGLDDQWSSPSPENKADYRNLDYGYYIFQIRAIGESGEWSEAFEYSFKVNPPWWHTWWARAGYGITGLLLIFGYSHWRTVQLLRRQEELETEIDLATEEIREQKRKVEESEKYKEQFLANMSHELRTPMHAISGMTKILERSDHPESMDPYLHAIRTSSDNLVVILNDVLDMSKIEAGKLQIESVPMSPGAIVEHVISLLKYKAEEKGIELTYEIGKDVPDMIMGDPTRLNQILTNLVGNGIKFTDQGLVHLSLTGEENALQFEVRDTGIGIPEDKLPQIFRMFEQSDKSINRRFGGTGLGLSISQHLAELMGGGVTVQSEVGKGSSFYVTLPYELASDQRGQELPSQARLVEMAAALTGLKILIAEDNPFNQMIAKDDLTYYIKEVEIDIVENGKLAVEHYRRGEYDIILMDAQMPEMDGMEATKSIRAVEEEEGIEERIPIIAMTASLLRSEISSYLEAGMDNYIPKPYQLEELIGTIYDEIEKSQSN